MQVRLDLRPGPGRVDGEGIGGELRVAQPEQLAKKQQAVGQRVDLAVAIDIEGRVVAQVLRHLRRIAPDTLSRGGGGERGITQAEHVANREQAIGQRVDLAVGIDIERRGNVDEDRRRHRQGATAVGRARGKPLIWPELPATTYTAPVFATGVYDGLVYAPLPDGRPSPLFSTFSGVSVPDCP